MMAHSQKQTTVKWRGEFYNSFLIDVFAFADILQPNCNKQKKTTKVFSGVVAGGGCNNICL